MLTLIVCILLETILDRRKPECFLVIRCLQLLIVSKVKCCVAGTAVWHLLEPGAINIEYFSLDKGMQTKLINNYIFLKYFSI